MVISDSRKKSHNILAAAGRRGIVKLIHVAADFCYGEIKAHKKPIATVCFSPTRETHLFSKSVVQNLSFSTWSGKGWASFTRGTVTLQAGVGNWVLTGTTQVWVWTGECREFLLDGIRTQQGQVVSDRVLFLSWDAAAPVSHLVAPCCAGSQGGCHTLATNSSVVDSFRRDG